MIYTPKVDISRDVEPVVSLIRKLHKTFPFYIKKQTKTRLTYSTLSGRTRIIQSAQLFNFLIFIYSFFLFLYFFPRSSVLVRVELLTVEPLRLSKTPRHHTSTLFTFRARLVCTVGFSHPANER